VDWIYRCWFISLLFHSARNLPPLPPPPSWPLLTWPSPLLIGDHFVYFFLIWFDFLSSKYARSVLEKKSIPLWNHSTLFIYFLWPRPLSLSLSSPLSPLSFLLIFFFISIFLSFISCEFERKERKKIIKKREKTQNCSDDNEKRQATKTLAETQLFGEWNSNALERQRYVNISTTAATTTATTKWETKSNQRHGKVNESNEEMRDGRDGREKEAVRNFWKLHCAFFKCERNEFRAGFNHRRRVNKKNQKYTKRDKNKT